MRISLAGGGTDFPAYYRRFGGLVVSAAIDKYVYVIISPNGSGSLQISSSDYSTFFRHSGDGELSPDGKLRYARAFLREFDIRAWHSLFMASEIPPGSGLGSSSALAVALTKGFQAMNNQVLPKPAVAEMAARIEIETLGMPIGKQDHYASAFGGLNTIHFDPDGARVEPIEMTAATRHWLATSILLFYTGESHESQVILEEQNTRTSNRDPTTVEALHAIKGHAEEVRDALRSDEPDRIGEIMHRSWAAKKLLASRITNEQIDDAYDAALGAGALGGKISGAGGGGFLMLVCAQPRQADVTRALEGRGLVRTDFHLDTAGARVLVNNDV